MAKRKTWTLPTHSRQETECINIDAKTAAKMLEHNQANRPLSKHRVLGVSQKMAAGLWVFTHQGLCFSTVGTLMDGQHRLAGIVKSGKSQRFNVTYNVHPSAFDHIDTGGTRSPADLLSRRCPGLKNKSALCGMAGAMLRGMSGPSKIDSRTVVDFVEWYADELLVPVLAPLRASQSPLVRSAPIYAAFGAAARGADIWDGPKGGRDKDTIVLLAMRLGEREWEKAPGGRKGYDPLRVMHDRLIAQVTSTRVGRALTAGEKYSLAISALRNCLKDNFVTSIMATDVDWGEKGDTGKKPRNLPTLGGNRLGS